VENDCHRRRLGSPDCAAIVCADVTFASANEITIVTRGRDEMPVNRKPTLQGGVAHGERPSGFAQMWSDGTAYVDFEPVEFSAEPERLQMMVTSRALARREQLIDELLGLSHTEAQSYRGSAISKQVTADSLTPISPRRLGGVTSGREDSVPLPIPYRAFSQSPREDSTGEVRLSLGDSARCWGPGSC